MQVNTVRRLPSRDPQSGGFRVRLANRRRPRPPLNTCNSRLPTIQLRAFRPHLSLSPTSSSTRHPKAHTISTQLLGSGRTRKKKGQPAPPIFLGWVTSIDHQARIRPGHHRPGPTTPPSAPISYKSHISKRLPNRLESNPTSAVTSLACAKPWQTNKSTSPPSSSSSSSRASSSAISSSHPRPARRARVRQGRVRTARPC